MKVIFIGGGNMACALIGGALAAGWTRDELTVVEPHPAQRDLLAERFGIFASEPDDVVAGEDACMVWAVKPQHMKTAAANFAVQAREALHISIAAGLRATLLAEWFGSDRVIRAMPNSAAIVGGGVTGLFALDQVSENDRRFADNFFKPSGSVYWMESDDRIDALTAISGSGPAYVFHFLESFQAAAEQLGFEPAIARSLTLETTSGAMRQVESGQESVSTLRGRVTSARGTTEAALAVLAHRQTSGALSAAVCEAYIRAVEIADEWDASRAAGPEPSC